MKKILVVMAVAAVAMAITALAEHGPNCPCCSKAKAASTNAPACTNAPVAVQPAK